jgi:hypothetical protein
MDRIPTDNHIRTMLDPVPPETLFPMFDTTLAALEAGGGLASFQRLGGHVLIALDGTEYFCSQKLSCVNCSERQRANGKIEHFHAMVSAALVAPGHARALLPEPEFVTPQDGADKQDCEARATHRWLAAHGPKYARLKPIYLGDDLSSRQATCEAVAEIGGHFLFTVKPSSHKTLYCWLDGAEAPLFEQKIKHGARFVTHLAELAACGRARWKIENETFNMPKTKGYNLEHNFGHGKARLAAVLATINLIALAIHTVADLVDEAWKAARAAVGCPQALLRGPASHRHRSGVPHLGRPRRDPAYRTTPNRRPRWIARTTSP